MHSEAHKKLHELAVAEMVTLVEVNEHGGGGGGSKQHKPKHQRDKFDDPEPMCLNLCNKKLMKFPST